MQHLQDLEIFEIEILELLNSNKILDKLFFGGGTMLRLCHNLNRYSTDLDFWLDIGTDSKEIFKRIRLSLEKNYIITDAANKNNTLLFEIKSEKVKRNLKIEVRKEQSNFEWEKKIAFSTFTNKQVMVNALTLKQMMKNKISAAVSRKIIRDFFDIEFLFKRGVEIIATQDELRQLLMIISSFKIRDYKVTLGSVLEEKERNYYSENELKLLVEEIHRKLLE
ncbi:MAG: nucleotidyl transferase AbiEii/AbiGii toxin family protein [Bacteroidota bacterium]